MPNLKSGRDCCGCTACASICGHEALTMQPDALGFLYPVVDYDKCVECKLCEKVCAFNDHYNIKDNFSEPETWGARLKNTEELMKSRSGGAFVAFSDWILDQGGVVYGVGYKDHFRVAHKRATTKEERDEFRGSKYVQSDLTGIFKEVRKDLLDGQLVMFTGTPCQTSALKSFLPKKLQDRIWLVDIVCHGVPSPFYWRDYIDYLEKRHGSRIVEVDFRNKKKFGWKAHKESVKFEDGSVRYSNAYTYTFYQHIMQRESCSNCHFCNTHRPSDLTLADFWGWERTGSHINDDDKGLSLILINTSKGKKLFESVSHRMDLVKSTLEQSMQGHLKEPTPDNPRRFEFEKDFEERGFEYVLRKYGNVGWKYRCRTIFNYCVAFPKRAILKLRRMMK